MAVPEDDRPVVLAREQALVVFARLDVEALVVRERRAMDVEDAVDLSLRRQVVEPLLFPRRQLVLEAFVSLHHFGPIPRRFEQPPLTVAADPGRVRQSAQALERLVRPGAPDAVVAT
jgi:hypothetical protein